MISYNTNYRNSIIHSLYGRILKPIFFRFDPEFIHDRMMQVGKLLGKYEIGRKLTSKMFDYKNSKLQQTVFGINFENPIGLSAGFDKNAELTAILPSVGFGFAELGSITGNACTGNAKPRLWRLPQSKSLLVYYGLKNDGCEVIASRLKKNLQNKKFAIPIGVSVAMTNCAENSNITLAIADFAKAFKNMEPLADYITVNISCPNTSGGQPFIDPFKLDALFKVLDGIPTTSKTSIPKPIFIKFSPDLNHAQIDALLDVAHRHRIHGIICTNLTKKRDNPNIIDRNLPKTGGLSGKVVQGMSDDLLSYIYKKENARVKLNAGDKKSPLILIGSGGVFTAEDAYRKIRLGASLIQLITGMIYEGPQMVSEINLGLARLLERDGFAKISDAIGVDSNFGL